MRILFTIGSLAVGGKERQLIELLKSLEVEKNIQFWVLLYKNEIGYDITGIDKTKLILPAIFTRNKIIWYRRLKESIINFQPDIVHCWENASLLFSYFLKPKFNYKLIDGSIRYSVKFKTFGKRNIITKLSFLIADKIIVNSYKGLEVSNIASLRKSNVIYNGIDLSRFEKLENIENFPSYDLICIANFLPSKDHETLIETVVRMNNKGVQLSLMLIGDGPELYRLKKLVPSELATQIIFKGRTQNMEVIIKQSKIGVLLSNAKVSAEGISNSIIEYMSGGLPVIATNNGGNPEVVEHGRNGFLINPFDGVMLENHILNLCSDASLYKKFSNRSKEIIIEKFLKSIMVRKYIDLYSQLYMSPKIQNRNCLRLLASNKIFFNGCRQKRTSEDLNQE